MEASDLSVHGSEEKEDRISDLPEPLICHILSLLPSTKEAIRTTILSKRWQNQWTRVPVLIFQCPLQCTSKYEQDFIRFIDTTLHLHDCSKIHTFHLAYNFDKDVNFISKVRFAVRKNVEKLILDLASFDHSTLPKFIFDNDSLVELQILGFGFEPSWKINWPSLKVLKIGGFGLNSDRRLIENILSGSPSLECLEIKHLCSDFDFVNFASSSLKRLILIDILIECDIDISCPNLEELYVDGGHEAGYVLNMTDKAIKIFVSGSPLLHTLEIIDCVFEELVVIASKSLKRLVVGCPDECALEISCPNLKELNLYSLSMDVFKVMNFPSLIRATLDFDMGQLTRFPCGEHVAKLILEQIQNVKELSIGSSFIKVLSDVEMRGLSYPWSNNKILSLDRLNIDHLAGIMCALRSSPALERLVIKLDVFQGGMTSNASGENCWNSSNGTVVNCLESHLKTVEIIGFYKQDAKCELMFDFIKFVLKNARVLEKLVLVISSNYGGTDFAYKVSQKVSSFPRCSQHAIVELCSE